MTDTLVTINPNLLEDPDAFSYRGGWPSFPQNSFCRQRRNDAYIVRHFFPDLQRLCKRLELGGKGSRGSLVAKLTAWHRHRSPSRAAPSSPTSEAHDMNVAGQRFALLNVHVAPNANNSSPSGLLAAFCGGLSPGGGQTFPLRKLAAKKRRHSIVGGEENNVECVSPRLLNPLKRSASCPTPKSAMKSKYVFCFSCMLGQGPLLSSSNQSRQGPPLSSSSQARTGFLNRQGCRAAQEPRVFALQRRQNYPAPH